MKNNESTQLMKKSGNKTGIIIAASVVGVAALGALAYFGFFSSNPWFISKENKETKTDIVQDPYSVESQGVPTFEEEIEIDEDSIFFAEQEYMDEPEYEEPEPEPEPGTEYIEQIEEIEVTDDMAKFRERPAQRANVATSGKDDESPVSMAMVEQKPGFPGGDKAMYEWLSKNIVYPAAASEAGASGKVTVTFVIEKDGSISNVKVVRGKHPALDMEAIRVVKTMPKWTPGRNNGKIVRVTYMLPVNFQLQ